MRGPLRKKPGKQKRGSVSTSLYKPSVEHSAVTTIPYEEYIKLRQKEQGTEDKRYPYTLPTPDSDCTSYSD
jgi:hypothetical protein